MVERADFRGRGDMSVDLKRARLLADVIMNHTSQSETATTIYDMANEIGSLRLEQKTCLSVIDTYDPPEGGLLHDKVFWLSSEMEMLKRELAGRFHAFMPPEEAVVLRNGVKGLREEIKVLKNELAAVEDALKDAIGRTKP